MSSLTHLVLGKAALVKPRQHLVLVPLQNGLVAAAARWVYGADTARPAPLVAARRGALSTARSAAIADRP